MGDRVGEDDLAIADKALFRAWGAGDVVEGGKSVTMESGRRSRRE